MDKLVERMIRAARLDVALYEEVEADESATLEAGVVVVISSVAAGIGTINVAGTPGIVVGAIAALIGWGMWALLCYLIGTKLLPEPQTEADLGQLLRTLGYASAPGVARILMAIPVVGGLAALVASVWMLVAMVIAVRQALDYESTPRAVAVCMLGFAAQVIIAIAATTLLAPPAATQ